MSDDHHHHNHHGETHPHQLEPPHEVFHDPKAGEVVRAEEGQAGPRIAPNRRGAVMCPRVKGSKMRPVVTLTRAEREAQIVAQLEKAYATPGCVKPEAARASVAGYSWARAIRSLYDTVEASRN